MGSSGRIQNFPRSSADTCKAQLGCEVSYKPGGEEDTVMGEADLAGGQADQAMDGERRA